MRAIILLAILAAAALFCSFVLFLLVALSLTIIKPIFLLAIRSTITPQAPLSIATRLRFGVWGVCASSDLVDPVCFGPKIGYDIPQYILDTIGIQKNVATLVQRALVVVLVLHPIGAALALVALIPALFVTSHVLGIVSLVFAVLAAAISSISLGIDIALVVAAKREVDRLSQTGFQLAVEFGNGVWMVVAAVALIWTAVVLLSVASCGCCGTHRRCHDYHDKPVTETY